MGRNMLSFSIAIFLEDNVALCVAVKKIGCTIINGVHD